MSDEEYGPSAAYLRACEELHVLELRALIAEHNRTCAEGSECESCIAPRLARENLRLRDECWQHQRDAGKWWGELADANGKLTRLLAVVDGRTTPPTDAEIEAHAETWRCVGATHTWDEMSGRMARALRNVLGKAPVRWWSLDAIGRPCDWPEVTT